MVAQTVTVNLTVGGNAKKNHAVCMLIRGVELVLQMARHCIRHPELLASDLVL